MTDTDDIVTAARVAGDLRHRTCFTCGWVAPKTSDLEWHGFHKRHPTAAPVDPADRLEHAAGALAQLGERVTELRREISDLMLELAADGVSPAEIARLARVSRNRVIVELDHRRKTGTY